MPTALNAADEALRKAQHGESLSLDERWAIHRRLLHLRNVVDYQIADDAQKSRELIDRYSQALSSGY